MTDFDIFFFFATVSHRVSVDELHDKMTVNEQDDKVRVFIVRHGQTPYNIIKRLQGHIDIDLNETGVEQAKLCAQRFANRDIDYLISSDLIRCQNTAKELLKYHPQLDLNISSSLRERMMGPVEGMFLKDALAKYGPDFKSLGETRDELLDRIYNKWDEVIDLSITNNYKNVIIVTHGGVITNFVNHLYSDSNYKLSDLITLESLKVPFNTSVTIVDINKEDKTDGTIVLFGDTSHLGKQLFVKDQLLR